METGNDALTRRLADFIEKNVSERRKNHIYGVADTASALARQYGADAYKAKIAALCHDLYREMPETALDYYVKHLGLGKKYLGNPNLSHGKIAALMIQRDFGITDEEIINAVSFHTTGRAGMSLLEKIIFIADAVEPSRTYPGVEALREALKEGLDAACLMSLQKTAKHVKEQGRYLDEDTVQAEKYMREEEFRRK